MGEAKRKREAAKEVLPNGVCLVVNRPTPQGYLLGAVLAAAADRGEPIARLSDPTMPPRCKSCAFTQGTIPNGCPETVLDAMGALIETIPFRCHQHFDDDGDPMDICSGWIFAMAAPVVDAMREEFGGTMPFERRYST